MALALYERHYSCRANRNSKLICGPGFKLLLLSHCEKALFVWRKFKDDSGQTGVNCAVFRNESKMLASDLIKEAQAIALEKWPGTRLYTYVNPKLIKSANPGYCFKIAGWQACGTTNKGLLILEKPAP